MTKTIRIFSWAMASMVIAGSLGAGAYFIVKFVLNKHFNKIDLGPKGIIEKDITNLDPTKIKRFNFSWYANANGTQFMTPSEYEQLDNYLSTHLYYGPESNALQEIVFGDRNVIHEGTSGLYFPSTQQLFINTSYYQNVSNIPFDVRRDSVFEVIAHEYGHHFASCYFKDYKSSDNSNIETTETYTDGYITTWNKALLDSFTNLFNLTGTLSKLKSSTEDPIDSKNESNINYTASVSDLYEYANHNGSFPLNKGSKYYFGINSTSKEIPYPYLTAGNDDDLMYIYSADEQFARKFEQAFFPKTFRANGTKIVDGITFMPRKYITSGVPSIWSPFAFDLAHTKQLNTIDVNDWSKGELIYPDTIFGGTMSDANNTVISNSASNLYSFVLKTMGYGTQLAQIFTENTQKVVGTDDAGYTYLTNKNYDEMNNIKFSGYLDKPFNNMVVVDKNNNVVTNLPLITGIYSDLTKPNQAPFHFFGKQQELTQYVKNNDNIYASGFNTPSTAYYSYIMKDYVNYNIFNGCSIYFNNGALTPSKPFNDPNSEKARTIYNGGGKAQLTTYKEDQDIDYKFARFTFDNNGTITIKNDY